VFVGLAGILKEPRRSASAQLIPGVDVVEPAGQPAASATADAGPGMGEGFRRIRAIRTLQRTWIAAFLFGAGTVPFATLLSNFYNDVYHVGPFARGAIGALFGVGGLFGIIGGGVLVRRVTARNRPEQLAWINGAAVAEFG